MPAIASHSTATTDVAWDGPAARTNLKNDGDAAYYKRAFAWYDSEGDATAKSTYRFIHHMVTGAGDIGAANTRACSAGIAVLNGGRGGTTIPDADRKGVYNHLARHIDDAGKDVPELASRQEVLERMYYGERLRERKSFPVLELKTLADGAFEGYASAYAKDLQGDRIMPGAFAQSIADKRGQIPIFYNHDDNNWVGFSTSLAEDGKGLKLAGQLATNTTAGKDVYELLKAAAAADFRVGMSIGFIANDWDWEGDARTLKEIDLWEASITPFPAQPKAFVSDVKSVRDFEKYLRDAEHFSRADARRLAVAYSRLNLSSSGTPDDTDRSNRLIDGIFSRSIWVGDETL